MKSSKKARRPKSFPPIANERWNFDCCVDSQDTRACYLYEYSIESEAIKTQVAAVRAGWDLRESPAVKRKIADWWQANPHPGGLFGSPERVEWGKKLPEAVPEAVVTTSLPSHLHFLFACSHFPSKHWLEIPLAERKQTSTSIPKPHKMLPLTDPTRFEATPMFIQPLEEFKTFMTGSLSLLTNLVPYYVFSLHWERSNRKLLGDFQKWLEENRPAGKRPFHLTKQSTSRRTTNKELLKNLSALRLLRHFEGNIQKARDHCEEILERSLYSDESSWRKAEVKALKEIRRFNTLAS
jgi:hypothetical protein